MHLKHGKPLADDAAAELARINERLQHEIVERQAVEQRLKISERHLQETQRLSGTGSWELDPHSGAILWSPELYRMCGRTPDTFVPTLENVHACMPSEDVPILAAAMEKAQATGHPVAYTHRFVRPDGSACHLRGRCDVVRAPDGSVARFFGFAQDVTDEIRLQVERDRVIGDLRRLQEVVERSGLIVAIWTAEAPSTVEYVSGNIVRFGYSAAEFMTGGKSWSSLVHPDDLPVAEQAVATYLAGGQGALAVTYRVVTQSGAIRWVRDEVTALQWRDGHPVRMQSLVTDITGQHLAESRARDLSVLNQTIVDSAPVGIAACDETGQCVFANPAMAHIVNAPLESILSQNIHRLASWRESGLLGMARDALTTGKPRDGIVCVRTTFGRDAWLDCTFVRFASGGRPHLLAVFHDLTARRDAEDSLRASELRYRLLADSIPDMFYVTDPAGRVLYANAATARLLDRTPEQMVGLTQHDLFSPEVADRHRETIRRVAATGTPFAADTPHLLDAARPVWIDTRLTPIRDETGTVTAVMGLSRDVTERRLMMAHLQESETRYRQLFEAMNEGCLLHDLVYNREGEPVDAQVTDINAAAASILGRAADAFVGRRASEFVPSGRPLFLDIYAALDRGHPPVSIESYVPFADKHLFLSFFSPRKGCIATLFKDISARKATEAKMAEYQQQLRLLASRIAVAGEQERRRIAVDLHDGLGQSLALCKMKLQGLEADAPAVPLKRQLQAAVRLVEDAIRDTRSLTFQLSPPVLHELGLGAATEWLAEQLAEQHGAVVRVRRHTREEPEGTALRVTVFQSLRELLLNAIKHARGATIDVDIRINRDHLEVTVTDDGAGFDTDVLRNGRNKGMGLFNVQERLQLIGGAMTLESQPGRGTRGTLLAPLAAPAEVNWEGGEP